MFPAIFFFNRFALFLVLEISLLSQMSKHGGLFPEKQTHYLYGKQSNKFWSKYFHQYLAEIFLLADGGAFIVYFLNLCIKMKIPGEVWPAACEVPARLGLKTLFSITEYKWALLCSPLLSSALLTNVLENLQIFLNVFLPLLLSLPAVRQVTTQNI